MLSCGGAFIAIETHCKVGGSPEEEAVALTYRLARGVLSSSHSLVAAAVIALLPSHIVLFTYWTRTMIGRRGYGQSGEASSTSSQPLRSLVA